MLEVLVCESLRGLGHFLHGLQQVAKHTLLLGTSRMWRQSFLLLPCLGPAAAMSPPCRSFCFIGLETIDLVLLGSIRGEKENETGGIHQLGDILTAVQTEAQEVLH